MAKETFRKVKINFLWLWCLVLPMVLLLSAGVSHAVGLGDVVIRSSLDAPFFAEINLLSVKADELDTLRASLAPDSDFRRAGIERVEILDNLVFRPSLRDDGSAMVQVTSREPITEPYLHFLVMLEWTGGRIVREYTALLDPPTYDGRIPAKISAPRIPKGEMPIDSNEQETRLMKLEYGQVYGPVKRGDYLIAIGEALDIGNNISIYQRLYGILRDNPHAFLEGNMNLLRAGVVLDIPSEEELAAISRVLAVDTFSRHVAEWQEYKARFHEGSLSAKKTGVDATELAVMQGTIAQLEEEIARLRGLLEAASKEGNSREELQYRKQLSEDIAGLEAARDRLVEEMDSTANSLEPDDQFARPDYVLRIVQPVGEGYAEVPSGSTNDISPESRSVEEAVQPVLGVVAESNEMVTIREKLSLIEETLLSRTLENEKLREQIQLLGEKVQKTVALLQVQDEALALAQQQAAVYSAALEASASEMESTSDQPAEVIQEEEVSDSADQIVVDDNIERVPRQSLDEGQGIGEQAIVYITDESNRPLLLAVSAILFLLLLLVLMLRRRAGSALEVAGPKFAVEQGLVVERSQMESDVVVSSRPGARTGAELGEVLDDRDIATKLDLARAYVEMGNHEAASELLFEVQARGTPEQKAEAERLHELLGS